MFLVNVRSLSGLISSSGFKLKLQNELPEQPPPSKRTGLDPVPEVKNSQTAREAASC